MEVHHKPRPWRGWREFAKELATIVLGVLIALGAGQTADWLHSRADVAEARRALRAEIATDADNARVLIEEERCLTAGEGLLIEIGNGVVRLDPAATPVTFAISGPVMSTWDVVKVSAASRMPFEERVAYSRFYSGLSQDLDNVARELAPLQRMVGYLTKTSVTADDRAHLVEDAAQARVVGSIRVREARHRLEEAKAMGIAPIPPSIDQRRDVDALCRGVGMTPTLTP